MSYIDLTNLGNKIPYDIDGSIVLNTANSQISTAEIRSIINEDIAAGYTNFSLGYMTVLFSQPMDVKAIHAAVWSHVSGVFVFDRWTRFDSTHAGSSAPGSDDARATWFIAGSTDTTNGVDGTWEIPTWTPYPEELPNGNLTESTGNLSDYWRREIEQVTFSSSAIKAIRIYGDGNAFTNTWELRTLHIYGNKTAGYNDVDLEFLDDPSEALKDEVVDYGNTVATSTNDTTFLVRNKSYSRIATSIVLSCRNDSDDSTDAQLGITQNPSYAGASVTLSLADMGPREEQKIYMRLVPAASSGPHALRVKYSVGAFSVNSYSFAQAKAQVV